MALNLTFLCVLTAFGFVYGAVFASFLGVVSYRVPIGKSIVKPPSHCVSCKTPLSPIDLIPILSYLFTKGKCRYCQISYGYSHVLLEFLSGLLFASIVFIFHTNIYICIVLLLDVLLLDVLLEFLLNKYTKKWKIFTILFIVTFLFALYLMNFNVTIISFPIISIFITFQLLLLCLFYRTVVDVKGGTHSNGEHKI